MTDFSDFKLQIADYANRGDWPDAVVTGFVRKAEEKLNAELRISRMICMAENTVTQRCAMLPDNWLESDLVLIASAVAPGGWLPIRYKSRDEFFQLNDSYATNYYTIEGRQIFFGGVPNAIEGIGFQIYYYAEVPVFADDVDSWVYTKYPSLYLYASLMHADLHAVGEESIAANMKQLAEDMIQKMNAQHALSRASGSRVTRTRVRSFG